MSNRVVSEAVALCIATRTPVLLWGDPGTGKTSMVRDVARSIQASRGVGEEEFRFETVIASLHEPSDFGGLPVVVGDETRFVPPSWAQRMVRAGAGLVLFDELTTAAPATQAALLRVILEGTVGDLVLPPSIVFVAAANPPETSAGGWEVTAPLANRFVHLDWLPDVQEVCEGFLSGFKTPDLPKLPLEIPVVPSVAGAVTGYLTRRPAHMLAVPADPAAASRGWPSPRAWETVIRLLSAMETCGATPAARAMLMEGSVGAGVAHELITYIDSLDLPDPEEALANPPSFTLPVRGDQRYAALASIAAAVASKPTAERWLAGWDILKIAADAGALDVAAVAARSLISCEPKGVRAPESARVFLPVMKATGLMASIAAPAQRSA